MLPAFLLAAAFATSPALCPEDKPFDDPLMAKMEESVRKCIKQSQDAIAEQVKIRAKILGECAGRPPNQIQQTRIDICEQIIRDQTKFAEEDQQRLDALIRFKRGVPWADTGYPLPKGIPTHKDK